MGFRLCILIDLVLFYMDVICCNFCSFIEISTYFRWTLYGNTNYHTSAQFANTKVHQDFKYLKEIVGPILARNIKKKEVKNVVLSGKH